METIVFETKQQLWSWCKDICSARQEFYKNIIDKIEQHGAAVKIDYLFFNYYDERFIKHPDLENRYTLMLLVAVYPAQTPDSCVTSQAQCFYSEIGVAKKKNDSLYQLKINTGEDKGLTFFLKRYASLLEKLPTNIALKHRWSNTAVFIIMPKRFGSFYKTHFFPQSHYCLSFYSQWHLRTARQLRPRIISLNIAGKTNGQHHQKHVQTKRSAIDRPKFAKKPKPIQSAKHPNPIEYAYRNLTFTRGAQMHYN